MNNHKPPSYEKEIDEYIRDLDEIKLLASNEGSTKRSFRALLESTCKMNNLILLEEYTQKSKTSLRNVRYDGIVFNKDKLSCGIWEAKDSKDDLDLEKENKKESGYDFTNFIIENTKEFMLFQNDEVVLQGSLKEESLLEKLLQMFFKKANEDLERYYKRIEDFQERVPVLVETLEGDYKKNIKHNKESIESLIKDFEEKSIIGVKEEDVKELLIQSVLVTHLAFIFFSKEFEQSLIKKIKEIGKKVFKNKLQEIRDNINTYIHPLLSFIKYTSVKDKFLILINLYQEFCKAYNPKKADTHGIVYTPEEVVDFMIKSSDYLMNKYWDIRMSNDNVKILEPSSGTGTFLIGLLNHFGKEGKEKLEKKYQDDIYAIEIDLMAYLFSIITIEETYKEFIGSDYSDSFFKNIGFGNSINTLSKDKEELDFEDIDEANTKLLKEIQDKEFLLIIGNPPYNANQKNESDNNRNKVYDVIDKRIKDTYSKHSQAQKQKLNDMYVRFLRVASDKVLPGKETKDMSNINSRRGMVSFITNRSYIDKFGTDGIRKCLEDEWDYVYVVDLGGDLRDNPKNEKGELKGNIFGIQTGVAICFLIKDKKEKEREKAKIFYYSIDDFQTGSEKLRQLENIESVENLNFKRIYPDKRNSWLGDFDPDFDEYKPLGDKQTKTKESITSEEEAIFKLYCLGVGTNRDEWVYDFDRQNLENKMKYFIKKYEQKREEFHNLSEEQKEYYLKKKNYNEFGEKFFENKIKWSRDFKNNLIRNKHIEYDEKKIITSLYRPFVKKHFYYDSNLNDFLTSNHFAIFGDFGELENVCIGVPGLSSNKPYSVLILNLIPSFDLIEKTQLFPRYSYFKEEKYKEDKSFLKTIESNTDSSVYHKLDNITDGAVKYFDSYYSFPKQDKQALKDKIFYFIYAFLHDKNYKEKYKDNLKRELPRIPLKGDLAYFERLSYLGKELADLHLDYESLDTDDLDLEIERKENKGQTKHSLSYDKTNNSIKISNYLTISNIPKECKEYTLGGRTAIEWVLEFYKESKNKIKDEGIKELFKQEEITKYQMDEEALVSLLKKVIKVSFESVKILIEIDA